MGDITQDSGSSRKSFRGRIPINASDATKTIRQKFNHFSEGISQKAESMMRGSSLQKGGRETSVYTKGVRQLNDHGYDTFNIDDGGEIFISKMSNNALFNDGEPILVRATDGNYVGRVDPFKAEVPAEEQVQTVKEMHLFQNVPRSSPAEKQISGVVGVVSSDGQLAVQPIDNGFLSRMTRSAKVEEPSSAGTTEDVVVADVPEEPAPAHETSDFMSKMVRPARQTEAVIEEPIIDEAPVEESFIEAPIEELEPVAEEAPVEEQIIDEAPVEMSVIENQVVEPAVDACFEDNEADEVQTPESVIDIAEAAPVEKREEFIIDADEEIDEESDVDTGVIESDDYSWVDDMDQDASVEEVPAVESIDDHVDEVSVEETPVEEVPVEETPVEEVPVEEVPAEEIPAVEEKIEVVPSLPGSAVVPEGLYVEGSEPSNAVSSTIENVSVVPEQTTETSGVAPAQKVTSRATLSADGEALPPMSDPVRKRPNSMRFRFDNGVLMNVGSKNRGSEEGPRSPLE